MTPQRPNRTVLILAVPTVTLSVSIAIFLGLEAGRRLLNIDYDIRIAAGSILFGLWCTALLLRVRAPLLVNLALRPQVTRDQFCGFRPVLERYLDWLHASSPLCETKVVLEPAPPTSLMNPTCLLKVQVTSKAGWADRLRSDLPKIFDSWARGRDLSRLVLSLRSASIETVALPRRTLSPDALRSLDAEFSPILQAD